MSLPNYQFDIATAIVNSILTSTEIATAIPAPRWKVLKRPWRRGLRWTAGFATVCALRPSYPVHENSILRAVQPFAVVLAWASDGSLVEGMADEQAIMTRIDRMFHYKGPASAPTPLRAINSLYTGEDAARFEQSYTSPADMFTDSALVDGIDLLGTVVTIEYLTMKPTES